jgi:heme-degrading monooxygenase HmoA
VIARVWSAHAAPERAPDYAAHLRSHVLPALRGVPGYAGAELLQRDAGGDLELIVITWWQSLDAIHGFAGADVETAVVADEAAALLTGYDERVRHYTVVTRDAV